MRGSFRRIAITFLILALLPVGFIIFELSSLSKNEKIVREIYQNQLESILYSVNQYSDDVINSWANRINMELIRTQGENDSSVALLSMLWQMNVVDHVFLTDLDGHDRIHSQSDKSTRSDEVKAMLISIIAANPGKIERLITYYDAGFKKMETLDTVLSKEFIPVFFVLDSLAKPNRLGVMVLNRTNFIQNVLGPKMQSVSQGKFVITAFDKTTDEVIYSTALVQPGLTLTQDELKRIRGDELGKKALWLLPGYYLAISPIEATIDDLVKDRVMTSLVLLGLLALVLIFGMIFLYRNIRKEMNLSRAKSEFVSNVSHEIRTPLALISMYAETLEMNRVPEDRKHEYYTIIAKETSRLSRIVNRILNFSRMEANKKKYEFGAVDINDLCDQVLGTYALHFQENGFTWSFDRGDSLPEIKGDRDSIAEAFINLLDNAMKYSLEQKEIRIRTFANQQTVVIEVRDKGMGIAKTHHHAIFEQFFRAPIGDVHSTKGSGLGLTLVKKTMEAHHGRVTVQSVPGQGSTFQLIFPYVKTPATV